MPMPSTADMGRILSEYGIAARPEAVRKLQSDEWAGGRMRLILRVELDGMPPKVVRLIDQEGVTPELLEAQSGFARLLREGGIPTPRVYAAHGQYVSRFEVGGRCAMVTVEDFVEGELDCIDAHTAAQAGALLARMHDLSERAQCHVDGHVLFDPLRDNELFNYEVVRDGAEFLSALAPAMYRDITDMYAQYTAALRAAMDGARCAVQGDMSDCNMYRTRQGGVGVFDFNRCGDSDLFCDAVMQGMYISRMMNYPASYGERAQERVLPAFLRGYASVRPFSARQRRAYPYLCALVNAFWCTDMKWGGEGCMARAIERGDEPRARELLCVAYERLRLLAELPV